MEVKILTNRFNELNVDALVVPIHEGEEFNDGLLKELNEKTDGTISSLVERREFRGKANETAYIHLSGLKAHRLLLVGIGKTDNFNNNRLREAARTAVRALKSKRIQNVAVVLRDRFDAEAGAQAFVEGMY